MLAPVTTPCALELGLSVGLVLSVLYFVAVFDREQVIFTTDREGGWRVQRGCRYLYLTDDKAPPAGAKVASVSIGQPTGGSQVKIWAVPLWNT